MNNFIKKIALLFFISLASTHVFADCTGGSFYVNPNTLTAAQISSCVTNGMIAKTEAAASNYCSPSSSNCLWVDRVDAYGNYGFCLAPTTSSNNILPLPEGYYLSSFHASTGGNQYGDGCPGSYSGKGTVESYASTSEPVICLKNYAYQKIPAGRIVVSTSSNLSNDTNCTEGTAGQYAKRAQVKVVAAGQNWCNGNGVSDDYYSSAGPTGFFLQPGGGVCPYGSPFLLNAIGSSTSGNTCARNYADIADAFVATSQSSTVNCGTGYSYVSVSKPVDGGQACVVNGTYDHPNNFVIKAKSTKTGCGAAGTSGPSYTVSSVVSGSALTGVCPESRIPTGYYQSGNAGGACGLIYSPISGNGPIGGVCMNSAASSAAYQGWYPSDTSGIQGNCGTGDKQFSLSRTDGTTGGHCTIWFNASWWVPDGYVISSSSCTTSVSGMKSYKVVPAVKDMQYCDNTTSAYSLPPDFKRGAVVATNNCPLALTKYYLTINRLPPASAASLPTPSVITEPAVVTKPTMPVLDIVCPGAGC